MELREYGTAVRRNWALLAVVLALAAAAGVATTMLRPPAYRATTVLFVAGNPTVTADPAEARLESYLSLLRGRQIARLIRDGEGLPLSIEQIQSRLDAERAPGTMLLTITATDRSAARATAIAAAATRALDSLAANLEPGGPSATITVAQPPQTTRDPSPLPRNLVLALVLGFVAGLGAIALREATRLVLREPGDLARLGVPLLGRARGEPDDYRRIRHRLRPTPTSLLITSPGPDEGAEAAVRGLASAFAETGCRVVILDADLRSGRDSQYPGLTGLLAGGKSLAQVLRVMPGGAVQLVPAGQPPADPGQALAAPALAAVILALTSRFDLVLVNGPPVRGSADAIVLSALTDGVLVTAEPGRTRIGDARRAVEALRDGGARITGAILSERAARGPAVRTVPAFAPPPVSPARAPADADVTVVRQVPLG
jgi:Mrp family chromosome partitioning ATPase